MPSDLLEEKYTPNTTTTEFLNRFQRFWTYPSPEVNPFTSSRSELYAYLAEQNLHQLEQCLPDYLFKRTLARNLSRTDSLQAAEYVEQELFITGYEDFPNIGKLIQSRQLDRVTVLNEENLLRIIQGKEQRVAKLTAAGVAALLVRPEVFHLKDLIQSFLEDKGFQVIYRGGKSIDFAHYWALYKHVFSDPVKENHVRRRALGYVDRPTELILFTDPNRRYGADAMALANGIKADHKGIAGVYEPHTLRGGIIYAEMTMARIGYDIQTDIALDPLWQYHYADPSVYSKEVHSHVLANLPGVHIPEGHEIEKDLGVLLTLDELKNL